METIYVVAKLVIGWEEVGIATKIKMKEACDDGNVAIFTVPVSISIVTCIHCCQYNFAKCCTEGNWIKNFKVHVLCYFSTISH